ncbi:hypothetical protein C4J92_2927 [Pseudomonas sp. R3-18-08]|nr:hypothetical protein C4J92_2927 [Pseudomonas sp. R3-18-08]
MGNHLGLKANGAGFDELLFEYRLWLLCFTPNTQKDSSWNR